MTKLPETKNCILKIDSCWLTIWLNRPKKRNALSHGLLNDISSALSAINQDKSIRGIVFRGKENVFCAGLDLEEVKKITSSTKNANKLAKKMSLKAGSVFKQIYEAPQFTISVVEGVGIAGAFGIACATDILITMADARYALTETKLGLTPAQIAPYVLNRLGFSKARKLMLLGSSFDGQKAFEMGMADFIANNDDELNSHLKSLKMDVKKCGPNAIAATKKIILKNQSIDPEEAANLFSDCMLHPEGREGFASFFEKRKPYWNTEKSK
tara:strand:+ start:434 stop:1240 length:807 start_codon:yes stop_codon:yes gene_type:complete